MAGLELVNVLPMDGPEGIIVYPDSVYEDQR